jgi:hypothetical protein
MFNLGIFSANQKPQPLGAPFGGFIFFGIMFIRFLIGIVTIAAAFFVYKYKSSFVIIGLLYIVYSIGYPCLLVIGNYELQHINGPLEKDLYIGIWKDNFYKLTLYADQNYKFEILHYRKSDAVDSSFTGKWRFEREDVILRRSSLRIDIKLYLLKYHDKYFLNYNLPSDLDAWNGYLGLMHIKDSCDYNNMKPSCSLKFNGQWSPKRGI